MFEFHKEKINNNFTTAAILKERSFSNNHVFEWNKTYDSQSLLSSMHKKGIPDRT